MTVLKEDLRAIFAGCAPPPTSAGKIAERLRRRPEYRRAKTIFMMPSPLLFQARINCLLDGKVLVMPSPALKLGFYRVKPFAIPFPDLAHGTSLKGITLFGKKMLAKQLQNTDIDLALTGCTAIDKKGQRLGEGTGFFDLSMGLLATLGGVSDTTVVGCVAGAEQVSEVDLPCDSWDVGVDFLLFQDQEFNFERSDTVPAVDWQALAKKQIRKVEPLWHLHCELFPVASPDSEVGKQEQKNTSPWGKFTGGKK